MTLPRIPRILFVAPGLLAGLLVPALTAAPHPARPGAVGMTAADFTRGSITIHAGQRITLVNDSRVVHVIGPGINGRIFGAEPHDPVVGFHLMQTNAVYTTPRWRTPGTYFLACSVHPHMNLKVIVIP